MLTTAMRDFVADLSDLVDGVAEPRARAAAAAARLRALLLADTPLLAAEHTEPDPDRYRTHLVHVDPAGRFSVLSAVWLPGHVTPVHSHVCWCVVGVLTGQEEETRYRLVDGRAVPHDVAVNEAGEVGWLVPPERDIHKVRNPGSARAVSLHVYGADIGVLGSSVHEVYPEAAA